MSDNQPKLSILDNWPPDENYSLPRNIMNENGSLYHTYVLYQDMT